MNIFSKIVGLWKRDYRLSAIEELEQVKPERMFEYANAVYALNQSKSVHWDIVKKYFDEMLGQESFTKISASITKEAERLMLIHGIRADLLYDIIMLWADPEATINRLRKAKEEEEKEKPRRDGEG